jgi:DNA-binding LacI/PurR family transcriptional regulator
VGNAEGDADEGARPVTIAYIAELAGVSVPTVSKVINGRARVSADTRARIEELVNAYGYRKPSAGSRSNVLQLVFRELDVIGAMEIIRGVERVAREHRFGVMVSEFGWPAATYLPAWDDAVARRPHCVLAVTQLPVAEREELRAKGIPFVVFDPIHDLPVGTPFVGSANWSGGRAVGRHLAELGHRRVAMIIGPDSLFCRAREDGFRAAMDTAGLPVDPDLVVRAALNREDGHAAAATLLARSERPTAIFASNDMQALGVYQAARQAGLRVPGDLSVVGFDDLPVVAWADPPLTTVHQPTAEMAVAAAEMALALGRGQTPPQLGLEIASTLVVRGSTAAPPSRPR